MKYLMQRCNCVTASHRWVRHTRTGLLSILKWLTLLTENVDTIPDLVVDFPELVDKSAYPICPFLLNNV